MFTAILLVSSLGQVPIYPTAVVDPTTKVAYYPCDPPASAPDVLKLTAQNQTVFMNKNATTGMWEATMIHNGQSFDYRLRKHFDNLVFQDRKTPSWTTYEMAVVPSGQPILERHWCYPDTGIRFSPFFYGRAGVCVIRE